MIIREGFRFGRRYPGVMKLRFFVAVLLACAAALPAAGQTPVQSAPVSGGVSFIGFASPTAADDPKFDLDFAGGSPADLVEAISQASGHPVNVIIPAETAPTELPRMNLRNVTVPALFQAISATGAVAFVTEGPPGHDAVWVVRSRSRPQPPVAVMPMPAVMPPPPPAVPREEVRVLNLKPYLNANLSVDDITTAIRVACEMLPDGGQPKLTFHKETNLLISRGRPDQLELVERVLSQLDTTPAPRADATPYRMDPVLARRYGLLPATPVVPPAADAPAPAPAPAAPAEKTPRF